MQKTKLLTVTVPCYNSQDYMRRCVESLLPAGEEVEIIIVDDGSTDDTGMIADEYAEVFPDIVRAVHKENGGHGSGVNAGMSLAKGTYFKVVDSDDWLDKTALEQLMSKLREFEGKTKTPDLLVCNYVYDHLEKEKAHAMNYRNIFPEEELCTWNEMGHFRPSQYLIMHALIYKTEVLRRSDVQLPEHTFYVDNIFAYQPLPNVSSIYYMNIDLYHYYLGREDQSVNEKVLMKRIDQQIKVTKIVSRLVDLREVRRKYPKLAAYMCRNISIMMAISSIHLLMIQSEEAYQKRQQLWNEIKKQDKRLYKKLKYGTISGFTYLPGRIGGKVTLSGYRVAKKVVQFQ
ncbi:glycosyltransferase family 2 protein [Hespellia stercorisuis]|uniref:Glycosyltransferases involved in cell wall biogenesis n=1 Tax=Hespellia stercorisuis DSM 15480 TaxID=1121950 RepID=A0A1M6WSM2_9FIRM|nr:glycosyltransferase family 2 protein [Hespellia stercorisuis]SHK96718.1 Glycosyltransferases involved in cell wall biogenesis [Hespellia stercorisuis DSM 15480]